MTPGFAKSRKELFWLPYSEPDKVIINSHNFTAAWSPAVNGKTPVAAWVPSRDTAGNGTTSLSDLTGNGYTSTLTNMDAATDWPADTSAGGVRAIDTDGSNDYCLNSTGLSFFTAGVWSVSCWIYRRGGDYFLTFSSTSFSQYIGCLINGATLQFNMVGASQGTVVIKAGTISNTTWTHIVFVMSASGLTVYVNGASRTLTIDSGTNNQKTWSAGQLTKNSLGAFVGSSAIAWFNGRHDDYRLFGVALDSTDVASLYASGLGRGIQA